MGRRGSIARTARPTRRLSPRWLATVYRPGGLPLQSSHRAVQLGVILELVRDARAHLAGGAKEGNRERSFLLLAATGRRSWRLAIAQRSKARRREPLLIIGVAGAKDKHRYLWRPERVWSLPLPHQLMLSRRRSKTRRWKGPAGYTPYPAPLAAESTRSQSGGCAASLPGARKRQRGSPSHALAG